MIEQKQIEEIIKKLDKAIDRINFLSQAVLQLNNRVDELGKLKDKD